MAEVAAADDMANVHDEEGGNMVEDTGTVGEEAEQKALPRQLLDCMGHRSTEHDVAPAAAE